MILFGWHLCWMGGPWVVKVCDHRKFGPNFYWVDLGWWRAYPVASS